MQRHSSELFRYTRRLCSSTNLSSNRYFYERDRRGGSKYLSVLEDLPIKTHIIEGRKAFVEHSKLLWEEVKEHFRNDPKLYKDGDTDVFFRFDKPECLKQWRTGSDSVYKEGFSKSSFVLNDKGKGVFSGIIDNTPPKDGVNMYAGYCGIKSKEKTKSFFREDHYDWRPFTHLEMRVRGDGRNYIVNVGLGMYFDVNWFDNFTYTFFTRGGPYWQVIRVPFSKFYLTSKGRIQDKQQPLPLEKVNSIGITAGAVPGPFHLEIDYIGCHIDLSHKEKCAYELYKLPIQMVSIN